MNSKRICDGAGNKPCPRKNPCEGDCHFNTAGLEPGLDKRWLNEHRAETALIVGSWALVVFMLCLFSALVYFVWSLL